jgi:alpha-D-xyloside xylohydrolase
MNRRQFVVSSAAATLGTLRSPRTSAVFTGAADPRSKAIYPGVWKLTFGLSESITPVQVRRYEPRIEGLHKLPAVNDCPVSVEGRITSRGYQLRIPLAPKEAVFGLGLQLYSLMQRGKKKTLRVNADPKADSGDTHAPVPFYVTSAGYGILVDTARYATFYCGSEKPKGRHDSHPDSDRAAILSSLPEAYRGAGLEQPSEVLVEIPQARGIDLYVFAGPSMRQAVQRYNLFSGGGAMPPRWGLGVWYRVKADYTQDAVLALAEEFRASAMPCDVIGLEPGWQSHSYSCTYLWSKSFPDPKDMVRRLAKDHFRVNLWEHAFTHPDSPIFQPLLPCSGDFEVWEGLVPDFLSPKARDIFADFHAQHHVSLGISGYKLDECDNSDFTGSWSFPEASSFPSGADGEQMHSLFGLRYQDTIQGIFDKRQQRTYGLVRSSHALAAPYPYVLYSDLYNHREFIRALVNAGFSGLL